MTRTNFVLARSEEVIITLIITIRSIMIYCSWYSNNIGNIDNSEETAVPGQRVRAYAYVGMRAPAQTGGRAGGRQVLESSRATGPSQLVLWVDGVFRHGAGLRDIV